MPQFGFSCVFRRYPDRIPHSQHEVTTAMDNDAGDGNLAGFMRNRLKRSSHTACSRAHDALEVIELEAVLPEAGAREMLPAISGRQQ